MKDFIISDLDGTLLNTKAQLPANTIAVIKRILAKGIPFTVATARSWDSAKKLLAPLNLKYPVILMNGIFVYDPMENIYLSEELLNQKLYDKIINTMIQQELSPFIYCEIKGQSRILYQGVFNESERRYVHDRQQNNDKRLTLVKGIPPSIEGKIIEVNAIGHFDPLLKVYHQLKNNSHLTLHFSEDLYCPGFYWLEISSGKATKGLGLKKIKKLYPDRRFVCFGDHINDISLFQEADMGVTPANGREELKKHAHVVLQKTNDEEAVASYLNKFYLKGKL